MWFFFSPNIIYGEYALNFLENIAGDKCFIVTDKNLEELGHVKTLTDKLDELGRKYKIFTEVKPDPQEEDVNHFDQTYFGKGYRWHNPKVHLLEDAYENAKKYYEYKSDRYKCYTEEDLLQAMKFAVHDITGRELRETVLETMVEDFIEEKNDLGIHSEMISDGVMRLVEKGVITCARKTLNPYKITICVAMGSAALYEWINYNSMVDMRSVEYTNDPNIIGQNDNMVSINSALAVDLLGQVAADMRGPEQFAGIGGQVDFVRGCRKSKGGRSIIAMSSTAAKGSVSRITASLAQGQAVTTSRHDVDYIITEHGIAHLWGKKVKDRARALIDIAAPQFRDSLREEFKAIYNRPL